MGHKKNKRPRPQEVVEKVQIGTETKTTLGEALGGKTLDEAAVSVPVKIHEPNKPEVVVVPCDKYGEPIPELPPEEKAKIQKNIDDREAAEDVLKMIASEFGDLVGNRFWEIIRDAGIEKAGMPMKAEIKDLAPFDNKRSEVFMKQPFPRGKYADMTILSIEKKEGLEYLERFATKQDFFQRGLSRYILWRKKNPLKKAKKRKVKKK